MDISPLDYNQPLTPLQTKKGEMIVFPDFRIGKVKATKEHKDMDPDDYTDIIPQQAIVLSTTKNVKRTAFDDVVVGIDPVSYHENKRGEKLKIRELGDEIFGKDDEISMAEYTKRVQKLIPVPEDNGDILTKLTNEDNLRTRAMYLAPMIIEDIMDKVEEQVVPHADGGWNPFGFLISFGLNQAMDSLKNFTANKVRKRNEGRINDLATKQQENLQLGTALQSMAIMGQDPNVVAPNLDEASRLLAESPDSVDQYIIDSNVNRMRGRANAIADRLANNTGSAAQAAALTAPIVADSEDQVQQFLTSMNLESLRNRRQKAFGLSSLAGQQAAYDADAQNKTTAGYNAKLSNAGNLGANYFSGQSAIEAGRVANLSANDNAYAEGVNSSIQATQQNIFTTGAMLSSIDTSTLFGANNNNKPSAPTPASDWAKIWDYGYQ